MCQKLKGLKTMEDYDNKIVVKPGRKYIVFNILFFMLSVVSVAAIWDTKQYSIVFVSIPFIFGGIAFILYYKQNYIIFEEDSLKIHHWIGKEKNIPIMISLELLLIIKKWRHLLKFIVKRKKLLPF